MARSAGPLVVAVCVCGHDNWSHYATRAIPCCFCDCDEWRCAPDSPICYWVNPRRDQCPVHGRVRLGRKYDHAALADNFRAIDRHSGTVCGCILRCVYDGGAGHGHHAAVAAGEEPRYEPVSWAD